MRGPVTDFSSIVLEPFSTNIISLSRTAPLGDFNCDSKVDMQDFAILKRWWLNSECSDSDDWCDGADLDRSGSVDLYDMANFAILLARQD